MEKTGRRFEAGTCTGGYRDTRRYVLQPYKRFCHALAKLIVQEKRAAAKSTVCAALSCHCDLQLCENKSVVYGSDSSEDEDERDEQFSD